MKRHPHRIPRNCHFEMSGWGARRPQFGGKHFNLDICTQNFRKFGSFDKKLIKKCSNKNVLSMLNSTKRAQEKSWHKKLFSNFNHARFKNPKSAKPLMTSHYFSFNCFLICLKCLRIYQNNCNKHQIVENNSRFSSC